MGLSETSVLSVFHPDAVDLFSVCSSLEKVCVDLHSLNTHLNEAAIVLCTPFRCPTPHLHTHGLHSTLMCACPSHSPAQADVGPARHNGPGPEADGAELVLHRDQI